MILITCMAGATLGNLLMDVVESNFCMELHPALRVLGAFIAASIASVFYLYLNPP